MAEQPVASPARFTRPMTALALCLAAGLAGCQMPGLETPRSWMDQAPPTDESRLRPYAETMGERYAANPDNRTTALNYATALRRLSQNAQAVAVLQRLAAKHPNDLQVLGAYGKALADAGRLQEAQGVLARSHLPERPDWTILSAQGSVADQLGDHTQAQAYYRTALKIVPNQPQVLSNLGLSYALEHRLPLAEATLRDAVAQPAADRRVRQNLALVLSVERKYREAEDISRRDLSPMDAAENVTTMKQMIAQSDAWRGIATPVRKTFRGATASNDLDR